MFTTLQIAETLGGFATVAIAVVAIVTAIIAVNSQREATAKDIYRDYLKLAFENPNLSNPDAFGEAGKLNKDEKYRWFVAFMLNSCDEIARTKSKDNGWRKTIILDLQFHKEYLRSPEFVEDGGWSLYSASLKEMADEALR